MFIGFLLLIGTFHSNANTLIWKDRKVGENDQKNDVSVTFLLHLSPHVLPLFLVGHSFPLMSFSCMTAPCQQTTFELSEAELIT